MACSTMGPKLNSAIKALTDILADATLVGTDASWKRMQDVLVELPKFIDIMRPGATEGLEVRLKCALEKHLDALVTAEDVPQLASFGQEMADAAKKREGLSRGTLPNYFLELFDRATSEQKRVREALILSKLGRCVKVYVSTWGQESGDYAVPTKTHVDFHEAWQQARDILCDSLVDKELLGEIWKVPEVMVDLVTYWVTHASFEDVDAVDALVAALIDVSELDHTACCEENPNDVRDESVRRWKLLKLGALGGAQSVWR